MIDAVHYALHGVIDVAALGCDFLLCSAYKFFAPHVGVLYARRETAELVRPLRLRTQARETPFKFEPGTLNHEGIVGAGAAVELIADMGRHHLRRVAADPASPPASPGSTAGAAGSSPACSLARPTSSRSPGPDPGPARDARRDRLRPARRTIRTSTVAFTVGDLRPEEVCLASAVEELFLWDGHLYAIRLVERLGLMERGGLVRAGLAPYTTAGEVERLLVAVRRLAAGR